MMKIQCNVCEAAEASVFCCADEAALCWSCDDKVHAANKLASKHQRVPLSTSNAQMPKCDICQETVGYFFCLEDRALLCRKCDVAIHTVNTIVSSHQRFLLTGVKVGLESADPGALSTPLKVHSPEKIPETAAESRSLPLSTTGAVPVQAAGSANFMPPQLPFEGGTCDESTQQWPFDEFDLELTDFNQKYNYIKDGPSKAGSPFLRAMEVERSGEVADACWAVPEIHMPPTASGLYWPEIHHPHNHHTAASAFVPDVCYAHHSQQDPSALKRRRRQF